MSGEISFGFRSNVSNRINTESMNENRAMQKRNGWIVGVLVVLALGFGWWYSLPDRSTSYDTETQPSALGGEVSDSEPLQPKEIKAVQGNKAPVLVLSTLDAFEFDNEDGDIEAEVESEQAELAEQDARIKLLEQSYEESEL